MNAEAASAKVDRSSVNVSRLDRPMSVEPEVWTPTPEEWDVYVQQGLDELGLTWAELVERARTGDLDSAGRSFWIVVRP